MRYLRMMLAFRASIDPHLARLHPLDAGLEPVLLLSELRLDCADLGSDPQIFAMAWNSPTTRSGQLGMMYVLEGSALGAHVLMAQAEQLGMTATRGARHLARQIADGTRWPAFLRVLEAAEPFSLNEAVDAAVCLFDVAISSAGTESHGE